ncbi:hypothetical protein [Lapidilactobacillus wuchangensis]|uniref:hypothetical protein n=1 Tax=Lapidilactobacillus wuchangensis TaxID=2486001 RepID=UPI000F775B12|nr:hypothetical protein [Lapidilactobacillus wuchangensis]
MAKLGIFNEYGPEYLVTFSQPRTDLTSILTGLKGNPAFTQLTEVGTGKGLRFRSKQSVSDIEAALATEAQLQASDYELVTGQFFGMSLD